MDIQLFLALVMFRLIMAITPGPNNLLLASCGFNFGFRQALPLLFGITAGFSVLILAVASGLGALLRASPGMVVALKVLGLAYIGWLALGLWRSPPPSAAQVSMKPGFLHGVTLQSVNLKAWIMALASLGTFATPGETYWQDVLTVALVFMAVGIPSHLLWIGMGTVIARQARAATMLLTFNRSMAALLMAWAALMLTVQI